MRLVRLIPAAFILFASAAPSYAQEWIEYYSRADFFLVNFPSQPTVSTIDYRTEYDVTLKGHVHSVADGASRYSVTVVDYGDIQKVHADRVKGCTLYPDQCTNPWVNELKGALDFAASHFILGEGKVTYYAYATSDRIEGRRIQLTNPDRSITFAAVYLHENRLFILEATVPRGAAPPALFQQSMGFLDKDGVRVRYATIYVNGYPAPAREPGSGRLQGCEE